MSKEKNTSFLGRLRSSKSKHSLLIHILGQVNMRNMGWNNNFGGTQKIEMKNLGLNGMSGKLDWLNNFFVYD